MSVQVNQRTLRQGDSGDDVRALQGSLNGINSAGLIEDGIFGPSTTDAVMNYQRDRGLKADGIVGPATWARILHDLN